FSVDKIFATIDLRHAGERLAGVIEEQQNRHTDLFADWPMTLALVQLEDDTCRLVFRQHHAIADGRAFIELLTDFTQFLAAARAGQRPTEAALSPISRHSELEALGLPAWRRVGWTVAGLVFMLASALRARLKPVVFLAQNTSNDYRGANGTVHWI